MSKGAEIGNYTVLEFDHAVLGRIVYLRVGAIGGYYRAAISAAVPAEHTVILTNAGAVPVKQTPQDITAAIKRAVEGEETNGV